MKQYNSRILALIAALAVTGWAGTASATLDLLVEVEKTKNVFVFIDIDIEKFVDVTVTLNEVFEGDAEALANANVETIFNEVTGACDESCDGDPRLGNADRVDAGLDYDADLVDSINQNTGIVNWNQDVGNFSNQGNVLSVARVEFTAGAPTNRSAVHSESAVEQVNGWNTVNHGETIEFEGDETEEELIASIFANPNGRANIDNSVNDNDGLVGVNQNTGNMQNQTHAMAFAYSETAAVSLSESELGQFNTFNTVVGVETAKIDIINNSLQSNDGVIRVNQSVGNMNNQATSVSFSALRSTLEVTTPFSGN